MSERRPLYPPIEPFHTGTLPVSAIHTLAYEQVGTPNGVPVIFLHGGPGVGAQPIYRRYFDPLRFNAIIFSQRGCGDSRPLGELSENNTSELVEDIEKLREALGIKRWFVFGGSWGSTLALSYALQHAERVRGLVLRGIYLGSRAEHHWMYEDGASRVYPEAWEKFLNFLPPEERGDPVQAYHERLLSSDREVQLAAANHWYDWEDDIIRLLPRQTARMDDEHLLAYARIENHFIYHDLFLSRENYLLEELPRIAHLPCWITQGRYDIICPPVTALALSRVLPESELHIIPDAGHSISEPGIVDNLIEGIESFAERF
ncbi:MAG TPA: prolyl aminopeptidase [Anaerolineaceae bacterium]|nr:prolyl aminopeptidase [Anaerolineaceae bacterium]